MIARPAYMTQLSDALRRAPVTALLGPRQVGKTTLARRLAAEQPSTFFDLEYAADLRRLENPNLALGQLEGLVILDEIQTRPDLFPLLRVLADRPDNSARFLILGSASPDLVGGASETLAGRITFVELRGFALDEVGAPAWETLWVRGGFPPSFLGASEADSVRWREDFVQTFLQRDLPMLGIRIAAAAMRRFWTMLAHYHGQTWNASEIGRAMGLSDTTVRSYLDILTGTFMVRQLQPWHANVAKRQVKAPKVYLRDSGLLHSLLDLPDRHALLGHPRAGASWEGFALEQVLAVVLPSSAYFWGTHAGAELDLLFFHRGRAYGIELKFSEAPRITASMRVAREDLELEHLWVVHPGPHSYPVEDDITAIAIRDIGRLASELADR
jgi:hypothetical protein